MKGKVKNQVTGKKYLHRLDHEVSTSCGFGFVEPLICREVAAQDTISYSINQEVYLNTLPRPTFGRVFVKNYGYFVPTEDIYHPYASLIAGESYRGSDAHYIPTEVPSIAQGLLNVFVKMFSSFGYYKMTGEVITPASVSFTSKSPHNVANAGSRYASYWYNLYGVALASYVSSLSNDITLSLSANDDLSQFDFFDQMEINNSNWLFVGKYSKFSKNLRKILIGCGYQLNNELSRVSLLPLIAYYKAYFDTFVPQRDITWKDTACFGFMERVEQHNQVNSWHTDSVTLGLFIDFLRDLCKCYYTQNPDFVSAHITGNSVPTATAGNEAFPYMGLSGNMESSINSGGSTSITGLHTLVTPTIVQAALNVLRRSTSRTNQHTLLGGKIGAFMRAMLGSEYRDEKESMFIGSWQFDVRINPAMSTAATSVGGNDAPLGTLGGFGIKHNEGQNLKYTAKCPGFFVQLVTIVPSSSYSQAVDPLLNHLKQKDFFDSQWDSLTLVPTPKYNVYGCNDLGIEGENATLAGGFGNIPNYMEYKIQYSKLNGELSQPSRRTSYLPFTLQKLLPFTSTSKLTSGESIDNVSSSTLVNGTLWRYIGKDDWLGNFNRIFTNSGYVDPWSIYASVTADGNNYYPLDDNFILHNEFNLSIFGYALPVSDSWLTDVQGDSIEVEHS